MESTWNEPLGRRSGSRTNLTVGPLEIADVIDREELHALIEEAIAQCAAASRGLSWQRRRQEMLERSSVLERKLDADIARYCQ